MKREETYRWLTSWNGKMSPTRYHCTEDEIRKRHPEAKRIEGTLIVREIPETEVEKVRATIAGTTHPLAPETVEAMLKAAAERDRVQK